MRTFIYIFSILTFFSNGRLLAQTIISGRVMDTSGNPIAGANVFLEGSYDGGSTDDLGQFTFSSELEGEQTLAVSFLTYETLKLKRLISQMIDLNLILKEDLNTLETVVLSAGSFAAGDNSKINVLKPLDVVTTASALGDFVGALQSLPGTTTVAEDGRLFIRGGAAEETLIFIDGIRVFTPYSPTTNNIPTRGRYSPFLFDGITFSTGGYSAEYGQALSGVLLLNTINEPDQEKSDIGIMSVGGTFGHTMKWKSSSLSLNASYTNLSPYLALFPDRNEWIKPFETGAAELVFRKQFDSGLLKLYSAFDTSSFHLIQDDINDDNGLEFKLKNSNFYMNSSYKGSFSNPSWTINTGLSLTSGQDQYHIESDDILDRTFSVHAKLKVKKRFNSRFKLSLGIEQFGSDFSEDFQNPEIQPVNLSFKNYFSSSFVESDIFISRSMAFKAGLRLEHAALFNETNWSPRLSYAIKTGEKGQLSLAYGQFYQSPLDNSLKFNQELSSQAVDHYIMNYQVNDSGRVFRAEAYYKDYNNLVLYDSEYLNMDSLITNDGNGFAKGIDLFWRDEKSVKNMDYWISYSYLDTERLFRNYPEQAQPDFVNKHNLSVVGKYWIEDWKSQVGFSYNYASGRAYTDPNQEGFHNSMTKPYNSLSLNWAYLIDQQKILYASVNNVFNSKNINGYQFAEQPDPSGIFQSQPIRPAADQFFFIGFFWTISTDQTSNQLDNL
ncbi:MAG: TonB-dependent receptor [Flavobacteriaceae bacterium]|nr:TonB-dependent receptor [Flavobacteriaceae bacterium]